MKSKIFPFFLVIIFFVIFSIFYKGLQNSNIYTPEVNLKKNIPSFTAKLLGVKNEISSKEIFKDDVYYLLNIWASWCVPCRDEHKFLMDFSKSEKIEIIGINYIDKIKNARNFLNELGNPYEIIISDLDGTLSIEWGAYGVPESFLISNNKIIKKYVGPLNQQLIDEINLLIK